MSTTQNTEFSYPTAVTQIDAIHIDAIHTVTRRLGAWTDAGRLGVRAHYGRATIDLRSPDLAAGDLVIDVDVTHAVVRLLVADDAVVDTVGLRRTGRSPVKDDAGPRQPGGRRIVLNGELRHGQIRVNRGGIAVLFALFTREYLTEARASRRSGRYPTIDDPTRARSGRTATARHDRSGDVSVTGDHPMRAAATRTDR